MPESTKEAQIRIDLENIARNRCYRRFSRIKFVTLTEEQRKIYMKNCIIYEVEMAKNAELERQKINARKDPEEEIRERNRERLAQIKEFKNYEESLGDPW